MLREADIANFETLAKAFSRNHAALVEVRRAADGAVVAAVCTVGREGRMFVITPFAVLVEGNPYELFDPPAPGGGFDGGGRP